MMLVTEYPGENKGALGVVSLEDVIEELIGEEIIDETDLFLDVANKIKVVRRPQIRTGAAKKLTPLLKGEVSLSSARNIGQRFMLTFFMSTKMPLYDERMLVLTAMLGVKRTRPRKD